MRRAFIGSLVTAVVLSTLPAYAHHSFGGTYNVEVGNGSCKVNKGPAATPNITITMAAQDYLDMINGKLNPQMAFMGGKLKIKGDMSLALKMQQIFPNT